MYDFLLVRHCSSILYRLRVIWRWKYGAPCDRLHTSSYSPFIVTMAIS